MGYNAVINNIGQTHIVNKVDPLGLLYSFRVVASQICEIPRNSPKIQTYSSSRSSKIDFGANQKRIYNVLLASNSNFGLISYIDIGTFCSKIARFPHPTLV